MSNYTNQNLITTTAVTGSRAIKIGDIIFAFNESDININLTKIATFVPHRDAFTAPSSFVVSGFGTDPYDETDYSDWNGTYTIISETEGLSGIQRKFRKGQENKYLVGWYDADIFMSNVWGFCDSPTNTSTWSAVVIKTGDELSGTNTWSNENMGWSMILTITQNNTSYTEIQQQLSGNVVTNYTNGIYTYGTLNSYETFDVEPKVGQIFASTETTLFGDPISYRGYFESEVTSSTIAYLPLYTLPKNGDKDQSSHKNYVTLNYDNFRVENGTFRESLYTYPIGPTPGGLVLNLTNSYNLNLPWTAEMYVKFYRTDSPSLFGFGNVQLVSDSTIKLIVNGSYPQNLPMPSYDGETWYHLAVVHTDSSITLYFNGVAGDPMDTSNIDLGTNVNSINIATNGESYYNFVGNICEFLVSNYAKYTENFIPTGI